MKRVTIESLISFMEKVNKEGIPENIDLNVWVKEITPPNEEQSISITLYHNGNVAVHVRAYCPDVLEGPPAICVEVGYSHVRYTKERYVSITQAQFARLATACVVFLSAKSREHYKLCESLGLELEQYDDLEVF